MCSIKHEFKTECRTHRDRLLGAAPGSEDGRVLMKLKFSNFPVLPKRFPPRKINRGRKTAEPDESGRGASVRHLCGGTSVLFYLKYGRHKIIIARGTFSVILHRSHYKRP